MFSRKLLSHLESHSEQMSGGLLQKIVRSGDCAELLRLVPANEQKQTMRDIYRQLTGWLLNESKSVDEVYYTRLGTRRAEQGVPFSEVLSAVYSARQYFWEYIAQETLLDEPTDFWGSVTLLQTLDCCFDSALRFAAIGYQNHEKERSTGAVRGKATNV